MSDYLLLKNKNRCPHCRSRRSFSGGNCNNCGMRLFIRPIDFQAYESDGNPRRYWLWTKSEGWIYRDHIIEGLAPMEQHVNFTPVVRNTKTADERVAEVRSEVVQSIRNRTAKRNQVGYGKSLTKLH